MSAASVSSARAALADPVPPPLLALHGLDAVRVGVVGAAPCPPEVVSVVAPPLCHTDLSSGFPGLRGMPFIEPDDVAARIIETLQRATLRRARADTIPSSVDADERAAYVERIKANA